MSGPRKDPSPRALAELLGMPSPTPQQEAVISYPLRPLLVVAGAGSGKTATMSQRVVHLVAAGRVRPEQVLGLTFTRKATAELDQRITTRLDGLRASGVVDLGPETPEPTISTYNAFAGGLLRDHGLRIGLDPDSVLITEARAWQIVTALVEAATEPLPTESVHEATSAVLRLDAALSENLLSVEQARADVGELAELFESLASVRGLKTVLDKAPRNMAFQRDLLELVQAYRDHKRRHSLLDFGEQIALACRIAEQVPEAARLVRQQYPAVLLDEFQDTSVAQVRLLSALFSGSGVTAVGDPNQAIYGWRGASAGALDTFHCRFNPAGTAAVEAGAPPQEHTPVLELSTAWRNDLRILDVANTTSAPLRHRTPQPGDAQVKHIPVAELAPRPVEAGLAQGAVAGAFVADPLQEAEVIAAFMAERWSPQASMAVLCRTREQFAPVVEALTARSIACEVVGLGGMLTVPEVADIRALLTVAADPERGDRLMRLLTGRGLGAADLVALTRLAREQVRGGRGPGRPGPRHGGPPSPEAEDQPLLCEAVEAVSRAVTGAGRQTDGGGDGGAVGLSGPGRLIVADLAGAIGRVRAALALPIPDLVVLAEQALGLDIELAARVGNPLGRRGVDAFRATAERFAVEMDAPSLASFLEWLEAAQDHESGLAAPDVEPEPGAVQVLTVHAAKGLEWDVVGVCGLVEQVFPSYRTSVRKDLAVESKGWMSAAGELPHPLRADAATLPPFELGALEPPHVEAREVKDMLTDYRLALGRHLLAEERRLAYVAFTRARHDLLLTGSHLAKSSAKPRAMSRFLAELRRRDLVSPYGPGFTDHDPEATNPLVTRVRTGLWPHTAAADDPPVEDAGAGSRGAGAQARARRQAALAVERAIALKQEPADADPLVARWRCEAELLLAERRRERETVPSVRLPAHVAATSLDELRRDPQAFALALRRPVPAQPQPSGRLGTVFHNAIAQRMASRTALLSLEEAGVPQTLDPAARRTLDRWLTTAQSLPLLDSHVLAHAEVERELTVGPTTLRCRIDAVFRREGTEPDDPGAWLIVDWKTGRRRVPVDQLSVYVHAWAASVGVGTQAVRAAYVYVDPVGGLVDELAPQQLLGLDEIDESLSP